MSQKTRFLAEETRFQGRYHRSLGQTLIQAYRPALARTLLSLAIGLIGRIALLGNANLIGYWVDSLCVASGARAGACHAPPAWLAGYGTHEFIRALVIANGIGLAGTFIFRTGLSRISADAVSRIYDETTLRTSRLPIRFFDQNPSGRIMTRFTSDYNNVFRIFGGPVAEFLTLIFDLVAMTLLLAIASPWLMPLWIFQGVLNAAVYRWYLPSLRRERRELAIRRSPAIAHFAESAAGASTIRAYGRAGVFATRFARLNDAYLEQRQHTAGIFARFSFAMGLGNAFTFLLTGVASFILIQSGHVGVGAMGVAFAYLGLSGNVLQAFFDWLGQFEEALTGLERINEYLRLPLEAGAKLPAAAKFATGHPIASSDSAASPAPGGIGVTLEIEDLWLRYGAELPSVLKGISLSVRAGERLAIVGRTGCGKTSLVQALFHLYPLERGSIRVAGVRAHLGAGAPAHLGPGALARDEVDLLTYRSYFAYITQEPTLFLGTIRDNLIGPLSAGRALGAPYAGHAQGAPYAGRAQGAPYAGRAGSAPSDELLVDVLRRVQFLQSEATEEEYRYWLDYPLEERGRNLSAGERQLLCMARCLLQDAAVVILDEATSAVDPRSEEILTRATDELFRGKTQIIVAHRLSTIRACDRVVWLQDGAVHKIGPPREILPQLSPTSLRGAEQGLAP